MRNVVKDLPLYFKDIVVDYICVVGRTYFSHSTDMVKMGNHMFGYSIMYDKRMIFIKQNHNQNTQNVY